MGAWNGWYHVSGSTYGTWLRGDPRGWRARRHREHVAGDYKSPPPAGTYDDLHRRSGRLLKKGPVFLHPDARKAAGRALVEMLARIQVEVLALSLDAVHYHALARFGDGQVRIKFGQAKKHASHVLRAYGLAGQVWAKKCSARPVSGRDHQVRVLRYIRRHSERGAWTWTFREGLYWVEAGEATIKYDDECGD